MTVPLVLSEQLDVCEGGDCPDFGVDRALVTVTCLLQHAKHIIICMCHNMYKYWKP